MRPRWLESGRTIFSVAGPDPAVVVDSFDEAGLAADNEALARLIKSQGVRWCELYSSKFDYDEQCKRFPKRMAQINEAEPRTQPL